jgi:SAM-dependent methyltransferase
MAYQDFLSAFAKAQGVGDAATLLTEHAQKYAFQIGSRQRAEAAMDLFSSKFGFALEGLRVLDVGCAYGAFTIELAKRGAIPVGIDVSDKWLRLAEANALGEVDVPFINCDASSRTACASLRPYGPFDLILVNDVFEHIYDTAGLLSNIRSLAAPNATLYFKIPNGHATRHVLLEGHKKVFGISLLPPDYWQYFVPAPFNIYYRRWEYFRGLFSTFNFSDLKIINETHDENRESTVKHIVSDVRKIRQWLNVENFKSSKEFKIIRTSCNYYFDEIAEDLDQLSWEDLFFKYRVNFWEGTLSSPS